MWSTTGWCLNEYIYFGKYLLSKDNKIHLSIIPEKEAYPLVMTLYIYTAVLKIEAANVQQTAKFTQ